MKTKHMQVAGRMIKADTYEELTAKIEEIFARGNVVAAGSSVEDAQRSMIEKLDAVKKLVDDAHFEGDSCE